MPDLQTPRKPGRINPEAEAQGLLQRLKVDEIPVPVDRIAKQLKIHIAYQPFRESREQDISGMLYREGDLAVLGVNAVHSETRQRFTIAHELGHFCLHPGQEVWVDHVVRARVNYRDRSSSGGRMREEVQANSFAAALLMPEQHVINDVRQALVTDPQPNVDKFIQRMASRYVVSPQAMEYRLIHLGLLDPDPQ